MAKTRSPRSRLVLDTINKEIAAAERIIADRTTYRDGLLAAKSELSKTILRSALVSTNGHGIVDDVAGGEPRSSAVQQILDAAEKPMTAGEVAEALRNVGRDVDRAAVAQVIYYLERRGHVQKVERGKWLGTQSAAAQAA